MSNSGFLIVHNCGYQGGVGAFETMAAGYGVKVGPQVDQILRAAPEGVADRVEAAWKSRGKASGIEIDTWMAAEALKVLWRDAHPAVVRYWRDMEDAAIEALKGRIARVGAIRFYKSGSFLFMELPSGRRLAYAFPKLEKVQTPWKDANGDPVWREQVQFKAVDSVTRQWVETSTYGGSLVENASQAVARDLLAEALFRLEAAGYPTILTVHDEAMAEVPAGFGSVHEYERLMSELPAWAGGLPLVAEGWEGARYRK